MAQATKRTREGDSNAIAQNDDRIASFADMTGHDAVRLRHQLTEMRRRSFPPASMKTMRTFTSGEVAKLVGVSSEYIRHLTLASEDQPIKNAMGHRLYTLDQIHEIRRSLPTRKNTYIPSRRNGEHMQVIAVTNFKGGSGKTTTAAHLAQHFAMRGYRTLAIDLDPQASLSTLFGYRTGVETSKSDTLYGAITYTKERRPLSEIIQQTYFSGLDLVPGNLELQEFEIETPQMMTNDRSLLKNVFFTRIAAALKSVEDNYDIVVIDCPPQLGYLTLAAISASTSILITVHPQMLDVDSMNQFLDMTHTLTKVIEKAGGKSSLDFARYIITRYEPTDGPQAQIAGLLRSLFEKRVLTSPILKSTAISDAGLTKQTLYEVRRENFTRSTYDRAMESLDAVHAEIEGLVRKAWGRAAQ